MTGQAKTAEMNSHAKFLFEHDFAAPVVEEPEEPPVPVIELAQHEVLLLEAREAGRAEGYEAGKADTEAQHTKKMAQEAGRTTQEAKRLANAAQSALAAFEADRLRVEKLALELSYRCARRLASTLIDARPEEEILALLDTCLEPLRQAPHLAVRLNTLVADTLGPMLQKLAVERGFEGRLVVLAEDGIKTGDCRLEWADGGIIRDQAQIEREIETLMNAYAVAHLGLELDLAPVELDPVDPDQQDEETPEAIHEDDASAKSSLAADNAAEAGEEPPIAADNPAQPMTETESAAAAQDTEQHDG